VAAASLLMLCSLLPSCSVLTLFATVLFVLVLPH
jgi:hypothetical protein